MNQQHLETNHEGSRNLDLFCPRLIKQTYSLRSEEPRELTESDLQEMLDFSLANRDRVVFYSMTGAGALPPFAVCARSVCREKIFPIEAVPRRELFRVAGAIVFALENFPFRGFTVMEDRAAEVAGATLRQLMVPFNLVFSYGEIVIVPRTQERDGFGSLCNAYNVASAEQSSGALSACGISAACQKLLEAKLKNYFAAHRQFML